MKYITILSAVVLTVSLVILAWVIAAQTKEFDAKEKVEMVETNQTAESEIRAVLEKYYEIARTGDRERLEEFSREISAPEYRFSSENGVMNLSENLRLLEAKQPELLHAEFDDLNVQVHGDAAIAKYRDLSKVRINEATLVKPTRFTNVWVRRDGRWLIVAEHSSRLAPQELLPKNSRTENLARR